MTRPRTDAVVRSPETRHAVVLGAGVIGLTTAIELLRRGITVTVVAEHIGRATTSWVAGALWEWPPAVCGDDRAPDDPSLLREKRWAATSYEVFDELERAGSPGVSTRPVTFYFTEPIRTGDREERKMREAGAMTRGFRHDPTLVQRIGPDAGVRDAYGYDAPQIDMSAYLPWLESQVLERGGEIVIETITGPLDDAADRLRDRFAASVLVNATGLGARAFGDTAMIPVRGALIRVRNDGARFERIDEAHCTSAVGIGSDSHFVFILPQGDDALVLGGIAQAGQESTELTLNDPLVRAIHERCVRFLPTLADAELLAAEPIRVGLRPVRTGGVRLEHDGARTVHHYGHGGAGVMMSWGSAREAANLAAMIAGGAAQPVRS